MSKLSDNERLCKFFGLLCIHTTVECPDYTSDRTLWDDEAYKAIEDAGYTMAFYIKHLTLILEESHGKIWYSTLQRLWMMHIATTAQKTSALSLALREMEGKG